MAMTAGQDKRIFVASLPEFVSIQGSVPLTCPLCGQRCYLGPAMYGAYKRMGADLVCLRCALKTPHPDASVHILPEQMGDLLANMPREAIVEMHRQAERIFRGEEPPPPHWPQRGGEHGAR